MLGIGGSVANMISSRSILSSWMPLLSTAQRTAWEMRRTTGTYVSETAAAKNCGCLIKQQGALQVDQAVARRAAASGCQEGCEEKRGPHLHDALHARAHEEAGPGPRRVVGGAVPRHIQQLVAGAVVSILALCVFDGFL